MTSMIRPLIPLLILGPVLALFSGQANAATAVATTPLVRASVAKVGRTSTTQQIEKARISTVALQSCVRSGNRMVC